MRNFFNSQRNICCITRGDFMSCTLCFKQIAFWELVKKAIVLLGLIINIFRDWEIEIHNRRWKAIKDLSRQILKLSPSGNLDITILQLICWKCDRLHVDVPIRIWNDWFCGALAEWTSKPYCWQQPYNQFTISACEGRQKNWHYSTAVSLVMSISSC